MNRERERERERKGEKERKRVIESGNKRNREQTMPEGDPVALLLKIEKQESKKIEKVIEVKYIDRKRERERV